MRAHPAASPRGLLVALVSFVVEASACTPAPPPAPVAQGTRATSTSPVPTPGSPIPTLVSDAATPFPAALVSPTPITPTPETSALASPSDVPRPQSVFVGNTNGEGVYLRRTPSSEYRDAPYPDGTELAIIGPETEAEGETWLHVRRPDVREGWVPQRYTTSTPPLQPAAAPMSTAGPAGSGPFAPAPAPPPPTPTRAGG
jgi:hypothetical protein